MIKVTRLCIYLLVFSMMTLTLFGCGQKQAPEINASATDSSTEPATEGPTGTLTKPVTETPTEPITEAPTEAPTEPATEAPTVAPTEAPTEPVTAAPTEPATEQTAVSPLSIDDIAFIGDSRTLTMATGGRYEFNLIPSASVFATWGGELTQDSAKQNAQAAAAAHPKLAIFWYGINDVQSDPGQTLSAQFKTNYGATIDAYRSANPDSEIVILSVLSTSVHEKDYYAGQEENIARYNACLADLCAENGYTYLDITELFTGDECLAEGDYIHFSKTWYSERFLPTVCGALNIDY